MGVTSIDDRLAFRFVGGLGALAGADFLRHLIRATAVDPERYAVAIEQQGLSGDRSRADAAYDPTGRKRHAISLIHRLEARGVDVILLPCFISQTSPGGIAPNIGTPVFGLVDALRATLATDLPAAWRIGVPTSDHVRGRDLFARAFHRTHTVAREAAHRVPPVPRVRLRAGVPLAPARLPETTTPEPNEEVRNAKFPAKEARDRRAIEPLSADGRRVVTVRECGLKGKADPAPGANHVIRWLDGAQAIGEYPRPIGVAK